MSDFQIVISFLVVWTAGFIFGHFWNRRRSKKLEGIAEVLGFDFNPGKDYGVTDKWSFVCGVKKTRRDRFAYQILSGQCSGYDIVMFDYRSGERYDVGQTFFILILPTALPPSTARRISKLSEPWGQNHVPFESEEFNHAFDLCSDDRQFAYAVCHPQMMEYLLADPPPPAITIEIKGEALVLRSFGLLPADQVQKTIVQLIKIRSLLPDYLFTKV